MARQQTRGHRNSRELTTCKQEDHVIGRLEASIKTGRRPPLLKDVQRDTSVGRIALAIGGECAEGVVNPQLTMELLKALHLYR
jgi:hypothetical protein